MAENKTKPTPMSVAAFIAALPDPARRADAQALVKLMQTATGEKPKLWGPSIIGFGSYHYTYESGREGDAPIAAFSPRKAATVLYGLIGFSGADALLARLGKHTTGKAASTSRSSPTWTRPNWRRSWPKPSPPIAPATRPDRSPATPSKSTRRQGAYCFYGESMGYRQETVRIDNFASLGRADHRLQTARLRALPALLPPPPQRATDPPGTGAMAVHEAPGMI